MDKSDNIPKFNFRVVRPVRFDDGQYYQVLSAIYSGLGHDIKLVKRNRYNLGVTLVSEIFINRLANSSIYFHSMNKNELKHYITANLPSTSFSEISTEITSIDHYGSADRHHIALSLDNANEARSEHFALRNALVKLAGYTPNGHQSFKPHISIGRSIINREILNDRFGRLRSMHLPDLGRVALMPLEIREVTHK